jgi:hypothetical protein
MQGEVFYKGGFLQGGFSARGGFLQGVVFCKQGEGEFTKGCYWIAPPYLLLRPPYLLLRPRILKTPRFQVLLTISVCLL